MVNSRWGYAVRLALVVTISLVAFGGLAQAADPSTSLSEAESRAASAEADVASTQARVNAARTSYGATSRRASPIADAARAAQAQARGLRTSLLTRQRQAKAQISGLEATHRQEVDDHDQEVTFGIGFGLAILVAAGIALAWGWFRASAAVAGLSRIDLGRSLALCLGGGLLLILVGAALSGTGGLAGAIGALVVGLGFVVPTALLLGRHSAEVQRGRAKPALRRERLPSWVARSAAALLFLLALGGLGSSIFAEQPAANSVSAQLREDATALTSGPSARQLAATRAEANAAQERAAKPLAAQRAARLALRQATRELHSAESLLIDAEADQRRFARRLAVLVAREEREAAKEEAQDEREAEELAEEETEAASGECDPNYSGCVPAYPPDADCAEVGETVSVYGSDPHGLDADGDLVACE